MQKNSIKRQDYPKHDIQRKDGESSKAKNGQAPKQHKGLLEKAISTSQQISLSFFKRALKETQWNKKERLLEKSTQANRYNSRAWSEWVSSLRKRDEGKKAAVVQKRAYAMNDKTRLVLKSISEKFGTPLQPFDLSEEQFNIQLVIEETQENQIKEKALNFYKALEDIHGDKRLTVLFQNDHKIFELDVPPGKGALTPERIQHFLHEVE